MRTTTPFLLLPLALLGSAGWAAPQEPQAPQTSQASQTPATQGLTVVRDAETGELRAPTPAELQALKRQAPAATTTTPPAQPQAVTGPAGERSVVLGERGLVYSVVKRGADGKLDHHCVDGAHAAGHVIKQPAPAAKGESRHDHR